jgi:hypothetical protein
MYVISLYGIHLETNKIPKSSNYNRIIFGKIKKTIFNSIFFLKTIFNGIENYLVLNIFYSILKSVNWIGWDYK